MKHPIQPLEIDPHGVQRFLPNPIVMHLLDTHPKCDLNKLARMAFDDEDRQQLAQLIGYSLGGFSELSYVTPKVLAAVDAAHKATEETIRKAKEPPIACTATDVGRAVWMHDNAPARLTKTAACQLVGVTLKCMGLQALGRGLAVDLGNGYVLHCTVEAQFEEG